MWTYVMEFYNKVWHQYWTVLDLFITIYIFYMLHQLNKNINKLKDDK